jgi:hypothetical protein
MKGAGMTTRRRNRTVLAAVLAGALSGCADGGVGIEGAGGAEEAGEVTVVSDDSRATVPPLCVEDIPEDLTTCPGAPANLGEVELDASRKATLQVPTEVATGGYRVRVNDATLRSLQGVLNDVSQQIRIPAEVLAAPAETVLTVEALFSRDHPRAVWQFLLSDPGGAPT